MTVYTEKRVPIVDTILVRVKLKEAIDFEGEDTSVRSKLGFRGREENKTSYISIKKEAFEKMIKSHSCVLFLTEYNSDD
jgi:translation initiation factor IF-3